LTREQFSQVAMISQGDFHKLLQADTKERQKIFRDIFGTGLFVTLQNQLKEKTAEVREQKDQASRSIEQYVSGILCDEDSPLSLDVKKAKGGELPLTDVMELLEKLLKADNDAQDTLNVQQKEIETELERVSVLLNQAESYANARRSLAEKKAEETAQTLALEAAQAAFEKAEASVPEQESISKAITQIAMLLPSYDELERKNAELSAAAKKAQNVSTRYQDAQSEKTTLTSEISAQKAELQGLANAAVEKEKWMASRQQMDERVNKLQQLLDGIHDLKRQHKQLTEMQAAYLSADKESRRLLQEYEAKNRAFLSEQAGIIAAMLEENEPCPVCGSTSHPNPAKLSENAATEADVKKAKKAYDIAQTATEKASLAAGKQQGVVSGMKESLLKESARLLPGVGSKDAVASALEQKANLTAQIMTLDQQIAEANDKIKRKAMLDTLIPEKEKALAEVETNLSAAKEQVASLTVLQEELRKQTEALRANLPFADKTSAEKEQRSLQMKLKLMKDSLEQAETALNQHKEKLVSIQATIAQLQKQLEGAAEADVEEQQVQKNMMLEQKNSIGMMQKNVHTRISSNESAKKNISKKQLEVELLESKYTWLKALSDTANGNLSGKDKIMLETYIQTTYFDRILERANLRLRKMSGGQYDLKRRRTAENKQSQSGLELDIVDHINTTERSVSTLSGGEAFLASLALALGLSDEVQMSTGIRLDTLFVDEGFGSLDSEALSKAYSTLAGLTEGNRLVGIISHVSELKERVDKQIVVSKQKTGGSSAQIIV